MSVISLHQNETNTVTRLWQRLWRSSRLLAFSALLYAILFVVMLALSIVDAREVVGAPVWYKPLKFVLSGLLYTGTLAWMLSFVRRGRRLALFAGGVIAVALFVEIGLIVFQAARGVPSHFNDSTAFDQAIFSAMGMTILVVWVATVVVAALLLWQRRQAGAENGALMLALRLSLAITLVGAALGMLMVRPTPEQMAQRQAGQAPALLGAHSVGVPDGGAGLPFTGWSTEGGDLRVPHFVGLHALQALPLAALFINRFGGTLDARRRSRLVWLMGLGYSGLILLLTWQALRGQPLIAPDALTLAALGALGVTILAAGAIVVRAERLQATV